MYGSNYKGWLTNRPDEVNMALKDILKIDNTVEIAELENELESFIKETQKAY